MFPKGFLRTGYNRVPGQALPAQPGHSGEGESHVADIVFSEFSDPASAFNEVPGPKEGVGGVGGVQLYLAQGARSISSVNQSRRRPPSFSD